MGRLSKPERQENQRVLECVRLVKKGQDDGAFQEIVVALDGYLRHLSVKKFYFVAGHSSDDIYQEGLFALATKAIPDYQEEKGPFISFAKLCIRRHIITVLKSANNKRNRPLNGSVSLDATVCNDDDDGPIPIAGFLPNGEEDLVLCVMRKEVNGRLRDLLSGRLTELETKVLDLYLRNLSYMDIVVEMNRRRRGKNRVVPKTIDNALCRIKKKAIELMSTLNGDVLES